VFEQVSPQLKRFRMKFPVPGGETVKRHDPCGMCGASEAAKVSEIQPSQHCRILSEAFLKFQAIHL